MKKLLLTALFIALLNFIVHFILNNDYALSWDYHFHYYGGLYHLGLPVPKPGDASVIPFTLPDPRLTVDDPFGPFISIVPTLSQYLFYDKWHLLARDSAYNLPMVMIGSLGVGVMYLFMSELFTPFVGLFSSLFLSLLPVYFGYTHNNMKDIPNAVLFAFTIYFFWRLVKYKKTKDLIISSLFFAVSFNFKINSIFIPLICFLWYIFVHHRGVLNIFKNKSSLFFLIAPIFALIIWWPFWKDPLGKLLMMPAYFTKNTIYIPVLYFGKIIYSGVNIPLSYPYAYLAVTTPLPILFFFFMGIIESGYVLFTNSKFKNGIILLLLWFFVPLSRYLSPQMGAIDGVRHFLEVVLPLCALASFGLYSAFTKIFKTLRYEIIKYMICLTIIFLLIRNLVVYHPYQTSYYNSLIGGLKGAVGQFDIDFWGTPQKEAVLWLNKNAPLNSKIYIAMAQSTAATYLRADLLEHVNKNPLLQSDYVVILNRQSFFKLSGVEDYINDKEFKDKIVYQKTIEEVPLVWVISRQKPSVIR